MSVLPEHRFIFIKTPGSTGTCLQFFLSVHCGEDDELTPIFPHIEPHVVRNYQGYFNPFSTIWNTGGHRVLAAVWNGHLNFCAQGNFCKKALSYCRIRRYLAGSKLTLEQYFRREKFSTNYVKYTDSKGRVLPEQVFLP